MKLAPEDLNLIKATRPLFTRNASEVADLFYGKLFAMHPNVRPMFPADMQDQGRKLMATMAVAVDALENWDKLAPVLAASVSSSAPAATSVAMKAWLTAA